jgi:hypothetical protein
MQIQRQELELQIQHNLEKLIKGKFCYVQNPERKVVIPPIANEIITPGPAISLATMPIVTNKPDPTALKSCQKNFLRVRVTLKCQEGSRTIETVYDADLGE